MAPTLFTAVLFLYTVLSIDAFAPITVRSPTPALASWRLPSAKKSSAAKSNTNSDDENNNHISTAVSRRSAMMHGLVIAGITTSSSVFLPTAPANARLEGVNKPELLPSTPGLNVIQVEKFLTKGQEKRMSDLLTKLEADTGYRVRVLCQAYPRTPGLAIRDYWNLGKEGQKDDKYVVLVVDEFGGKGNVLNFNVGEGVKFALPNVFWTRLTSKYGTTFYVKENGIDLAITNAIEAIVTCLRSEDQYCVAVPDEGVSLRSLGM